MSRISSHREIPENLEHIIAKKKGELDSALSKAAREATQFLIRQKGLRIPITNYLATFEKAVDLFRQAPMDTYASMKERERRKFTKEVDELTEHPISHLGTILKLIKVVGEMLEHMLEHSGFFGLEKHEHHAKAAHHSNGHHASHVKNKHHH